MMRYDPQRKENLGERFHQSANACGSAPAMTSISIKETPALNALKVLRGAPISMGRGEIPVSRSQRLSVLLIFWNCLGKCVI